MIVLTTLFAGLALAATVATVAILVTVHVLPTGLSPITDPVSAYGISRYRLLYRAQTVATAVAAGALAIAISSLPSSSPAILSLLVLAAARALIGWFPMDAPGATRSPSGSIHDILAFVAFAAASVSGFMVAIAFGDDPALGSHLTTIGVISGVTTAASALTLVSAAAAPLRRMFGLVERLIYVGMLSLLAYTSVALLLHP